MTSTRFLDGRTHSRKIRTETRLTGSRPKEVIPLVGAGRFERPLPRAQGMRMSIPERI